MKKSYLNLGCGHRYHAAWTNIDLISHGPDVIPHDLSNGIPVPDFSCDVVYHAAALEHLRRADALAFLVECYRVLRPGGLIRVGVPDLERLCRLYLDKLETALSGDVRAADDYDWIMLELYDQTVREQSGGGMLAYLRQDPLPNEDFVLAQIGEEGCQLLQRLRQQRLRDGELQKPSTRDLLHRLRRRLFALPHAAKRRLQMWLLGKDEMRALAIGRFRLSGEVHQWMYDRYSLSRLLKQAGFCAPVVQTATSSQIPDWLDFHLDALPDGTVIKPDLLFMEATKKDD